MSQWDTDMRYCEGDEIGPMGRTLAEPGPGRLSAIGT